MDKIKYNLLISDTTSVTVNIEKKYIKLLHKNLSGFNRKRINAVKNEYRANL